MTPLLSFVIGLLLASAGCALVAAKMRRQHTELTKQLDDLASEAEKAFEMIASHPHGLLIRDLDSGRDIATDHLAASFGLPENSDTAFDDLCRVLRPEDAERLRGASQSLTQYGKGFELTLARSDSATQMVHITGRLIMSPGGSPIAQALWAAKPEDRQRPSIETSQPLKAKAFAIPQGDDRVPVETLLDLLPFPAWRRDQALDAVYVNEAGRASDAVQATTDLARTALEEGTQAKANLETTSAAQQVIVMEAPLDGAFGTIGFAIEKSSHNTDGVSPNSSTSLYTILDGLKNAVAVFGADQRIIHCNQVYRDLWQLDEVWLQTKPGMRQVLDHLREQRLLPEVPDYRRFRDEQSAMVSSLNDTHEDSWHLPDGRTVHQVATPGPNNSLIVAFEDVSDRLRLERSYKSLNASQREILENLSEAVAVFAIDGQMTLCNTAFAALWDLPKGDLTKEFSLKGFAERVRALHQKSPQADQSSLLQKALLSRSPDQGSITCDDGRIITYVVQPLSGETVMVTCLVTEMDI